jgi:hypothetical protein
MIFGFYVCAYSARFSATPSSPLVGEELLHTDKEPAQFFNALLSTQYKRKISNFTKNILMAQQNYANHRRFIPGFHVMTSALALVIFAAAAYKIVIGLSSGQWLFSDMIYTGLLPLCIAIALLLLFWYSRSFIIRVQDRAIRGEENLRHFMLTGKPLDHRLHMKQVVALRFAHDDEFLPLIERAIKEHLTPDEIKKAIKTWRADHHRV